jgi:cytochrome b6-f complex iron-sulfur subunit
MRDRERRDDMESESQQSQGEETQEQAAAGAGAQPAPGQTVDTPVAKPVPARRILTRRIFILGGFWSTLGLALVGLLGPSLDFTWTRDPAGAARKVFVSPNRVPKPGDDPVTIPEGRFFLVNLEPGVTPHGEKTEGGLLALWQKCPHLGCTVPWRPDFTFGGHTGWFRCPCHGSTFTKEGGILVFGPSSRPMDRFPVEVQDDGSLIVTVGVSLAEKGSLDNPAKAVPYKA